jgi:hypothetical protein
MPGKATVVLDVNVLTEPVELTPVKAAVAPIVAVTESTEPVAELPDKATVLVHVSEPTEPVAATVVRAAV